MLAALLIVCLTLFQATSGSTGDDTPLEPEASPLVPGRPDCSESTMAMVLTEQSPSPAQLQRAAEAALLGAAAAHPLCPIPADAQPTMSQLMAVRDATRAADAGCCCLQAL